MTLQRLQESTMNKIDRHSASFWRQLNRAKHRAPNSGLLGNASASRYGCPGIISS